MSRTQEQREASTDDVNSIHEADADGYRSMRGCLTLTAVIIVFSIITAAFIVLFGSPVD